MAKRTRRYPVNLYTSLIVIFEVNYTAKRTGVGRHMSVAECLAICPEMKFVHVATYSTDSPGTIHFYEPQGATPAVPVPVCPARSIHKACLAPYRKASVELFQIFTKFSPVLEKGGLDEVYLDVTETVDEQLDLDCDLDEMQLDWTGLGVPAVKLSVEEEMEDWTREDLRLLHAAKIALRLRETVKESLGYECSAGIGNNKMLAKLGSALNKPYNQTYILPRHVKQLMERTPLRKIRFLGGKLGLLLSKGIMTGVRIEEAEQEEEGDWDKSDDEHESNQMDERVVLASDLWPLTVGELSVRLGGDMDAAKWAYDLIRGIDTAPVTPRSRPKSLMAAKSMSPALKTWAQVSAWLGLLTAEIWERLQEDVADFGRWPQTLGLQWKVGGEDPRGHAMPFPFISPDLFSQARLVEVLVKTLKAMSSTDAQEPSIFPCTRLTISVSKFVPTAGSVDGKRFATLDKFMARSSPMDSAPKKRPNEAPDDLWKCLECNKRIAAWLLDDIQEHQDYHFAKSLQFT